MTPNPLKSNRTRKLDSSTPLTQRWRKKNKSKEGIAHIGIIKISIVDNRKEKSNQRKVNALRNLAQLSRWTLSKKRNQTRYLRLHLIEINSIQAKSLDPTESKVILVNPLNQSKGKLPLILF